MVSFVNRIARTSDVRRWRRVSSAGVTRRFANRRNLFLGRQIGGEVLTRGAAAARTVVFTRTVGLAALAMMGEPTRASMVVELVAGKR